MIAVDAKITIKRMFGKIIAILFPSYLTHILQGAFCNLTRKSKKLFYRLKQKKNVPPCMIEYGTSLQRRFKNQVKIPGK